MIETMSLLKLEHTSLIYLFEVGKCAQGLSWDFYSYTDFQYLYMFWGGGSTCCLSLWDPQFVADLQEVFSSANPCKLVTHKTYTCVFTRV